MEFQVGPTIHECSRNFVVTDSTLADHDELPTVIMNLAMALENGRYTNNQVHRFYIAKCTGCSLNNSSVVSVSLGYKLYRLATIVGLLNISKTWMEISNIITSLEILLTFHRTLPGRHSLEKRS